MGTFIGESRAGISLSAGGVAFGLFWGGELVDLRPPWMLSLGVHGLSIVLIAIGLVGIQRATDGSSFHRGLGWTAVAVTLIGLLSFIPLLAVGLALVGLHLMALRRRPHGAALLLGGLIFFGAYMFGTHLGDESASPPGAGLNVVFGTSLTLIVGGLIAEGLTHAGRDRAP